MTVRTLGTILFAGHDFRFVEGFVGHLESAGWRVIIDHWRGHSGQNVSQSRELLAQADVIWCEWALGNAVWYSEHKAPDQRLVVRVHSQELRTEYLRHIRADAVDTFICVSPQVIYECSVRFGVPFSKCVDIPNFIASPKVTRRENNEVVRLGMAGYVPYQKRLDLLVDIAEEVGPERCEVRVAGKSHREVAWLTDRDRSAYVRLFERIETLRESNRLRLTFDGEVDDMWTWYQDIDFIASLSDYESFHMVLAEGVAAGCIPLLRYRPGVEDLYPLGWVGASISDLVSRIVNRPYHNSDAARSWVLEKYGEENVFAKLERVLVC